MRGAAIVAFAALALTPGCRPAPMTTVPAGASAPSPSIAPESALVAMSVDPSRPKVGEPLTIAVRIERGREVFGVPFHVTFDPAVVRFESAGEGSFLRGDGAPTTFMTALASPGRVVVGLSRLGQVGGSGGSGDLCVLRFVALASGDAAFAFDAAAVIDPKGLRLEAAFEAVDASVE